MTWLLLFACTKDPALPSGGAQPDVILLSIDTLRADHVGSYGYERDTTPFLDELAAKGTRYENARSPSPWTLPTHTTMLSGQLPIHHGVVDDGGGMSSELPLIQERFAEAGYATGAAVATLFVGRKFGFSRGFDRFDDFGVTKKNNLKGTVDAEQVFDAASAFTRDNPGEPVFLFLHVYDVHYPYQAPGDWEEKYDRKGEKGDLRYKTYFRYLKHPVSAEQMAHQIAQYDEEIAYVDHAFRQLVESFWEAGREPLIVVTADHGEEFGERGSWGHAHTLNPEQLHVPLIVQGPGVKVQVEEGVVGTQDIAHTFAALLGEGWTGDGQSLWGNLSTGEELPTRGLLGDTSRFETNRLGWYAHGLRLDWDLVTGTQRLYADPLETQDVASERPEDRARLEAELIQALGTPWEADPGTVRAEDAAIFAAGALQEQPWTVDQTAPFAVIPVDATLRHDEQPLVGAGQQTGPLRHAGSALEEVGLSEAERERLRALGYMD